jgi:hypothetical protein
MEERKLYIGLSEPPAVFGGARAITKWNPFKVCPSWDPFRDLEEMQNRFLTLLGRRRPALRVQPEEEFALMQWLPPVDIAGHENIGYWS